MRNHNVYKITFKYITKKNKSKGEVVTYVVENKEKEKKELSEGNINVLLETSLKSYEKSDIRIEKVCFYAIDEYQNNEPYYGTFNVNLHYDYYMLDGVSELIVKVVLKDIIILCEGEKLTKGELNELYVTAINQLSQNFPKPNKVTIEKRIWINEDLKEIPFEDFIYVE